MTITVFIRYQLDPFKRGPFETIRKELADHHSEMRRRSRRLLDAA